MSSYDQEIAMPQMFNVSRRNLVTLAAGAAAAGAVPAAAGAATAGATTALADPTEFLALSRERVLQELQSVRRAPGASSRTRAFGALAAAIRLHCFAGSQVAAHRTNGKAGTLTALYRASEPESVLAQVMVRELEATAVTESAWTSRFAELEAILLNRTA